MPHVSVPNLRSAAPVPSEHATSAFKVAHTCKRCAKAGTPVAMCQSVCMRAYHVSIQGRPHVQCAGQLRSENTWNNTETMELD